MSKAMSLKARIKNIAVENHVPAQAVLQNFMLERILERVSVSKYKENFILKGGMLIASMVGIDSRTTMDMDTTLRGFPLSEEMIQKAFLDICAIKLDDEVELELSHISSIRDDDEYGGYRVAIIANYEAINTPLKIDITTGDIITPQPVRYSFPSNFEEKEIAIWAYNIETVLAEKVETVLRRSVLNTRLRDFYDIYIIMKTQKDMVSHSVFLNAIRATAKNRMSTQALEEKSEILNEIQRDDVIQARWGRYCRDNYYANGINFDEVIDIISEIMNP